VRRDRRSRLDFAVEDFLLTFALPNFFFPRQLAYRILRNQAWRSQDDYIGQMRLKG